MICTSIKGILNAIVIGSSGKTIPDCFMIGWYFGHCPFRIAKVSDNRSQIGKTLIFIFTGCLQPVFTVLIDDNTTLIKAVDDWNEIPSLPHMRNTAYLFPSGIMEHCHCRNDSRYSAISLYVVRQSHILFHFYRYMLWFTDPFH